MRFLLSTVRGFVISALLAVTVGAALPALAQQSVTRAGIASQSHHVLFVTSNGAVLAFRLTDNGNVAPQFSIEGPATRLNNPTGIAMAPDGRLAVDNLAFSDPANAKIFAAGARGNVRPAKTISCGGITVPLGAAFDRSGNLYVTNGDDGDNIVVFAPNVTGCVSSNRFIAGSRTQLHQPYGIAVDASGAIYVANASGASVAVFAPGSSGDATPRALIAGARTGIGTPGGLALDSAGNLYVDDFRTNSILVFAPGANGNAVPARTIVGPHTRLDGPAGIGVDTAGNIYVANSFANTITMYGAGARGDASPLRTLTGPNTRLLGPGQLTIFN